MNPLWVILGIVLVTYLVYVALSYILYSTIITATSIGPEQIDLSTVSQVASSEQLNLLWTKTEGSTLVFFIYPEVNDRTSVSGNEYTNVVQLGTKQAFQLLVAPDAGRGYGIAPAALQVYVKGSTTPDTIDIQGVFLQKWTSVVIVKQGRKFNIYINGILRVSHTCTAMPDFDPTQPLLTGDTRLGGKIALVSLAPYPMQVNDVRLMISKLADTSGQPYLSSGISLPVPKINDFTNLLACPGGNCTTPIQAGPMEQWSSPYA